MALDKPYKNVPGTIIFDAEQARKGYQINQLCMSFMKPENRERYLADREAYLDEWQLTPKARQAILDLRTSISFSSIAVQVVARDFEIGKRLVIVDRGSLDGITEGDVVIGAGGTLVGRVVSLSERSAQVRLVSDPEFAVTAEIAATGAIGILRGRGANPLSFEDIDALRDVPVGAEVTTSGIELSATIRSAFPRGLSIGRVVAVSDPSGAVIKSAEVEPILELDSARTLLVITNYDGGLSVPIAP